MKIQLEGNIGKLRQEYLEAHIKKQRAEERELELLIKLRENCKHFLVAEVPYEPETPTSSSRQSFRVCEICGIDEEGRAFYKTLNSKRARIVSREEGYNLRQPLEDIEY